MTNSLPTVRTGLRLARLNKGLSQGAVGELLGIQRTAYNRIERGRVDPRLFTRVLLAAKLGVDPITLEKSTK